MQIYVSQKRYKWIDKHQYLCQYHFYQHHSIFSQHLLFSTLGFELRASCLLGRCSITCATPPALFYIGYIWDMVSQIVCWDWLGTLTFQISASWVAKVAGISHQWFKRQARLSWAGSKLTLCSILQGFWNWVLLFFPNRAKCHSSHFI
jgi:hypothetical protein